MPKSKTLQDQAQMGGLAGGAVKKLRQMILAVNDGTRLGSEEAVRAELGVSRAILRQAARILEHEQLLVVRRGVGGGFFARRPSVDAVARSAASFLQAHNASMGDTVRIAQVFAMEIAQLAAQSEDAGSRARLVALRDALTSAPSEPPTPAEILKDDAALLDTLTALADAPTLGLFQQILHAFGRQDRRHRIYHGHPERCTEWRRQRLMLIDAVIARDPEMAALLARRQNELSRAWIDADEEMSNPPGSRQPTLG